MRCNSIQPDLVDSHVEVDTSKPLIPLSVDAAELNQEIAQAVVVQTDKPAYEVELLDDSKEITQIRSGSVSSKVNENAAGKHIIPVEFWFIAVAVASIGLLIFGWRLRLKNAAYALVIQGGAVGLLYITAFSAAKFFTLMPLGLTFFLMLVLAVFSCILAVLQDSKSLAVFATVGGFLAPILTSTRSGNHVALFSHYVFLNAGLLGSYGINHGAF